MHPLGSKKPYKCVYVGHAAYCGYESARKNSESEFMLELVSQPHKMLVITAQVRLCAFSSMFHDKIKSTI